MFKTLMAVLAAAFMFAVLLALTGVIPLTSLVVFTAVLLLGTGLAVLGRRLIVWLAAFSVAAALSGCATADIASMIKASDDNPECYKNVHATVTPVMLFGWAVPLIGGTFDKVCHADKAPKPAPVVVGTLVAPAASTTQ